MKKLLTFAAASVALGLTAQASAGTIDFGAYGDGNESGVADGTTIYFDGLGITFYGNNGYAYFDGPSGGLPAGLGVCGALTGAAPSGEFDSTDNLGGVECADSSDDSIDGDLGEAEGVRLDFDEAFDVLSISFRDGVHNVLDNGNTLLFNALIDGVAGSLADTYGLEWTFGDLVDFAASGGLEGATRLWFGYGGDNAIEFYVEAISDVPVPGALPLLLSGIAGLGFASRRRKAAK